MTALLSNGTGPSARPPLPGGTQDLNRRNQAALRLRLMTGNWLPDLDSHLTQHFVNIRKDQMGKPDLSTNMLLNVIQQLSVLYAQVPNISNDVGDTTQVTDFVNLVKSSGWWSMATENQEYTLALRENLVAPRLTRGGTAILNRIVTSNNVYSEASSDDPDLPSVLIEARIRKIKDEQVWTWDYYDVRDPEDPKCKILVPTNIEKPTDVTEELLGESKSGSNYPFRWTQGARAGQPYIPYTLYHAKRTGRLWNGMAGLEVVEGTLTMAILWTFWLHNVKDCSWAQKWSLDAYLRGVGDAGDLYSQRQSVVTDPSTILQFTSDGESPSLGQFNPAIDPKTLGDALREFESRLAVYLGLSRSDFEIDSGAAESGYAISLRRDSIREAQGRFEEQFRRGDLDLITKLAAMYNLANGTNIPEDGWGISYPGLPKTAIEVQESIGTITALIEAGLASQVDAYIELHPGTSREAALDKLLTIRDENRRLQ